MPAPGGPRCAAPPATAAMVVGGPPPAHRLQVSASAASTLPTGDYDPLHREWRESDTLPFDARSRSGPADRWPRRPRRRPGIACPVSVPWTEASGALDSSLWMMSRMRAPGLSSVPTRSAPATSATIGQPGKDMSAAHGGRGRHRGRLRPRPGPPQRGPGRSRLDGPATRHLWSVGSAHPGRARRRRLSPGGMRGPRRIVCGVAARCPRPARSPRQLGPSRPRRNSTRRAAPAAAAAGYAKAG